MGALGGAKRAWSWACAYARDRKQFGNAHRRVRPHPQEARATSRRSIYVAESMALPHRGPASTRARRAIDPRRPAGADQKELDAIEEYAIEASILKVFGSEMLGTRRRRDACRSSAATATSRTTPSSAPIRDARINRIFEGTNEINRLLVPGTLLKRALQGQPGPDGARGPGAGRAGRPGEDRSQPAPRGRSASSARSATSPSARWPTPPRWACRSTCRPSRTSKSCWACWRTA